ncbi:hypothetical protein [Flexivirga alba]|uniref:Serine/threonine protein kinase n=1 Tax=Flexivirga alba TaxID=702742 RepID=A0ABW2AAP7_9MICO
MTQQLAGGTAPDTERFDRPVAGPTRPDPTERLDAAPGGHVVRPADHSERPVPSMAPGRFVPPPDPRIGQSARTGTLTAVVAALAGISAVLPTVGITLLVLWAVAARWSDKTITSMVLRRYSSGPRKSDTFVAAVTSPWHGVVAALATLLTVLIPAFVGGCTAAAVALIYSMAENDSVYLGRPLPVAIGVLIGALVMWWGPGGIPLRRGSRSIVRGVVRGQPLTRIIIGLCIVIAVLGAVFALTHLSSGASWWPIPSSSSLKLQLGN